MRLNKLDYGLGSISSSVGVYGRLTGNGRDSLALTCRYIVNSFRATCVSCVTHMQLGIIMNEDTCDNYI